MVTEELIKYLKQQAEKNISQDILISKLKNAGWKYEDIKEGFNRAFGEVYIENKEERSITKEAREIIEKDEIKNKNTHKIEKEVIIPKPVVKINSNIPDIPTIPSINTQIDIIRSDNEELLPKLAPKEDKGPSQILTAKEQRTGIFERPIKGDGFFTDEVASQKIRKSAIISSYQKDFDKENVVASKTKRITKILNVIFSAKFIFPFLILIIAIGLFVSNSYGYLKIPNLESLFVGRNSEKLLVNSPNILSSLLVYKTKTEINITLPKKIGTIDNQLDPSSFNDFGNKISIKIDGLVNQKGLPTSSADSSFVVEGETSLSKFITNLKSNGPILFVPVVDLNKFILEKSETNGFVAIREDDLEKIGNILTENFKNNTKTINIQKFLLETLSSYLDNVVVLSYKEHISSLSLKGVSGEKILGIETYKYNINDSVAVKNFLKEIIPIFSSNTEAENRMKGTVEKMEINSFDIWLSQKGDNLFKFRIIFKLPIEEIDPNNIYEEESFAQFDWQTTYYDFGELNKIKMPDNIINISTFIKGIGGEKITPSTPTNQNNQN